MKMFPKFTLAVIAFVCMTQVISAQTVGKSAWMLGGSAEFKSDKAKDAEHGTTIFTLDATLGYFFANDFAIGLNVFSLNSNYNGATNHETTIGPYVRYYISDPIFIQVKADLALTSQDENVIGAEVGYSLFLNNNVAIEPAIFYNIYSAKGSAPSNTEFGVSLGIQAFCNRNHGTKN